MMQYQTCRHVKEDGTYCGSPALRDRKYCYYHLLQRGRRLRRARALRDNLPYRLEIQSLDNLYAVRAALTDIAQALAAGQLDPRTAGKLLYAIQQVSSTNRRIEQMEAAAAAAKESTQTDNNSRIQEYPELEKQFGLPPGADLDAETDAVLQKADEETGLRQSEAESIPTAPPRRAGGLCRLPSFPRGSLSGFAPERKHPSASSRLQPAETSAVRNHDEEGDDVSNALARTSRRHRLELVS